MDHQEAVDAHRLQMRETALLAERDRAARAEAAARANDTFLAMLGHELRNPLAPILSAAELLRQKAGGTPIPEVDIIERQARHLDRLVSDLLDVSRVTTGRVSLRRSTVDLSVVLAKAIEMARPLMERKRQVLSIELPDRPILVDGDEARLCQVASNLLNNASIYSEADSRVRILLEEVAGEATISVIDDGIGIAPGMLEKIFGLFIQGGRSQDLAPGGLGLGLGVARSLVELHGGRIEASSAGEGCGSRFTVRLPALVAGTDVPTTAPRPRSKRRIGPARRVLLVDDNVDSADSMGELARAAGHRVVIAYGPEQALAAVAEFRPQVALLDIGLPTMDGYQLGLELRRRLGDAPLTLIALSGYGEERDRQRSRAHGFAAHLVKPAEISEVLKLIAGSEEQIASVSRSSS
jgi:CheY-like chemotaxis protein